jgi:hypothetical protein
MSQDHRALVDHLGETARTLETEVPAALAKDDLTYEEAERLQRTVDTIYDQSERLIELLDEQDADPDLVEAAEGIEERVGRIHERIGARVIELLERRDRG